MIHSPILRFLFLLLFISVSAVCADAPAPTPWDGFRGHAHDGTSTLPLKAPAVWPQKLKTIWSAPVGAGYSSPITDGTNVYLQERTEKNEFLSAFDVQTGKQLWRQPIATQDEPWPHLPAATPAFADGALYVQCCTGVVLKLNARDGKLLWKRDVPAEWSGEKQPKFGPNYGPAASPLIDADTVVLQTGTKEAGKIVALRCADGTTAWDVATGAPGYGMCMPFKIGENAFLGALLLNDFVVLKKDGAKYGLLATFTLSGGDDGHAATPLPLPDAPEGRVLLSGPASTVLVQIDAERKAIDEIWHIENGGRLSSPVAANGRVYLHDGSSLLSLNPASGKTVHALDGMDAQYCALLSWDDTLWCRLHDGSLKIIGHQLSVMAKRAEYSGEDEGAESWSSVIPVGPTRIVVRGGARLKCLSWEP
jgi:outer membrane protein assembly factor BamB